MVEAQALGELVVAALVRRAGRRVEVLAAVVAEVGLGRAQVVPVGLLLHADAFDGDELALDAEQLLDDALRFLVAPLAEVVVANVAVHVDEVERRPVVVVEGGPDPVVVVERDRVVDRSLLRRHPDTLELVLEREFRRVHSDDDEPVVSVGLRPGAHVRLGAQPVDARQRPEVHDDDVAAELLGGEGLGVEPRGRAAEGRQVLTFEDGHQRAAACCPRSCAMGAASR